MASFALALAVGPAVFCVWNFTDFILLSAQVVVYFSRKFVISPTFQLLQVITDQWGYMLEALKLVQIKYYINLTAWTLSIHVVPRESGYARSISRKQSDPSSLIRGVQAFGNLEHKFRQRWGGWTYKVTGQEHCTSVSNVLRISSPNKNLVYVINKRSYTGLRVSPQGRSCKYINNVARECYIITVCTFLEDLKFAFGISSLG